MTYKSTGRRMRRFDPSASADERQGLAQRKRIVRAVAGMALAFMVLVGGGALLASDVFRIREGRVEGNEGLPAQGILAASGVMGQHWFQLNLDQSARSVKDLPGIDAANIRCEWQKECIVLVKVTQALARLDAPGATMWVDQTGRAQKTWDNARARVVVKLDDKALLPADGKELDPDILSNLRELIDAQPDITQYAYTMADGFGFVNDRNWKVQIGTSRRAGAMAERSRMAQTLRDQLVSRNIQPKLIDVRVIEAPYYVSNEARSMAETGKIVTAIDIGSSKIVTLVGEAGEAEGDFAVVGVGIVPSRGMKRGQIVNVNDVTQAIRESVDGAERSSATKISAALVSMAGNHIQSQNSHGAVAIGRGEQGVTQEDVNRVLEAAQAVTVPNNREVIHVIPRHFKIDEQDGVRHPMGMLGYRLEAQTNIVTASSTAIQNLYKCLHLAQIEQAEVVLAPLASAEATLTPTEREMGVVMADIGHGTTDIAVYIDGAVWHVSVLEVGGWHFTSDLAKVLRLPLETAEQIKISHGHASLRDLPTDAPFVAAGFGDEGNISIQRRDMAEILHERARELFDLIMQEVKRSGYDGLLPAGLVLTGGGSSLPGMREVGRDVARLPVRIAMPTNLHGLVDSIRTPAYSTSVGLVKWGMLNMVAKPARRRRGLPSINLNMKGWLSNLFPRA